MLRKTLLTASAIAMVLSPIAAQAAPRAASPVKAGEKLAGTGVYGWIIALAVAIAVVVIIADDHNENKQPASP